MLSAVIDLMDKGQLVLHSSAPLGFLAPADRIHPGRQARQNQKQSTESSEYLQSASLCLTTTPAEQLALGLRFWLTPLGYIGLPVAEISLTLLLSLRFLAVVFEEIRNLALGLAARSVQWDTMGKGAGLQASMSGEDI